MRRPSLFLAAVLGLALLVPAATFAQAPPAGAGHHRDAKGVLAACRQSRLRAIGTVLGLSPDQLRQDLRNHESLLSLAQKKGLDKATFRQKVQAELKDHPGACRQIQRFRAHQGEAFLYLAARAMGMKVTDLHQAVFREGFPAVVQSKGLTVDQLIQKMAQMVVQRAQARGKTLDSARIVQILTDTYHHLIGEPPSAAAPSGA